MAHNPYMCDEAQCRRWPCYNSGPLDAIGTQIALQAGIQAGIKEWLTENEHLLKAWIQQAITERRE